MACFFFVISLATFLSSIYVKPGYLKPHYEFIWLVDNFLETNIHLDNLCIFCQVIKSDSSFHCTICNKCSANYDHHCPFIDNCLGTTNHKYFLLFLANYFIYTIIIIVITCFLDNNNQRKASTKFGTKFDRKNNKNLKKNSTAF